MMTRSNHGNADVEIVICRRGQWYPIGRMESCVHDVHMHAWIYHEFSLLYTPENNRIESHELNLPIVVLSRITSSHSYPHPTPPHTTHFCMPVSLYPQHECVCLYPTLFDRNWQHIKVMRLILLLSHKQQSKYVQICNLVSVSIIYQYTSRNTHITHTKHHKAIASQPVFQRLCLLDTFNWYTSLHWCNFVMHLIILHGNRVKAMWWFLCVGTNSNSELHWCDINTTS